MDVSIIVLISEPPPAAEGVDFGGLPGASPRAANIGQTKTASGGFLHQSFVDILIGAGQVLAILRWLIKPLAAITPVDGRVLVQAVVGIQVVPVLRHTGLGGCTGSNIILASQ